MARITVEDCLEHIQNHYSLVLIASHRARMLQNGIDPRIEETGDKTTVLALREIAQNKVDETILDEIIPEVVAREEARSLAQLVFNSKEEEVMPSSLDKLWEEGEKGVTQKAETKGQARDVTEGLENKEEVALHDALESATISLDEIKDQELSAQNDDDVVIDFNDDAVSKEGEKKEEA
ncbi:MAG: DNA-directed RNA polymerase subunit omega [Candidatus Oxydemutatoraceae bacterium WSBS_2016_MAG_OTU14]